MAFPSCSVQSEVNIATAKNNKIQKLADEIFFINALLSGQVGENRATKRDAARA